MKSLSERRRHLTRAFSSNSTELRNGGSRLACFAGSISISLRQSVIGNSFSGIMTRCTYTKPAYKSRRSGEAWPFPISNFATRAFPALWTRSPVQFGGETEKVIGFPILSSRYREQFKALSIDAEIENPDLRRAITRRVVRATLQPASRFMEAICERISMTDRASSGGTRKGPSFENDASYNPKVLIALLNISRVHYNFFEFRQYVTSRTKHDETEEVEMTMSSIAVTGEN